jgi:hypothetical protein
MQPLQKAGFDFKTGSFEMFVESGKQFCRALGAQDSI